MLGAVFGFEAYISDVENFPDYYDVLGVPFDAPPSVITEQMLMRIHELKHQEDEAMSLWRERLEAITPWLTPQEQWATPKAAKLTSLLIEAHTILTDDSERKFLYNYGGHSSLFFLRKICVRSQGFIFSPFVGFFATKHAVTVAGLLRCLILLLLVVSMTLFSRKMEIEYPTHGVGSDPIGIPAMSKEIGAAWTSVFIPLYMVCAISALAILFSFGLTHRYLDKTRTLYFLTKRTNFLRSMVPILYFAFAIGVSLAIQQTVGVRSPSSSRYISSTKANVSLTTTAATTATTTDVGTADSPLSDFEVWLVAMVPFWLLMAVSILIAIVHLVDTFVMPWTIAREAEEERLHTTFFGHVHLSLQQERETFYWKDVPRTFGNVLHIIVHTFDVVAAVVCPLAFAIILLSVVGKDSHILSRTYSLMFGDPDTKNSGFPAPSTNATSQFVSSVQDVLSALPSLDSEAFPIWHRLFLILHIRVGVWLLATLANGWLEVFTSEERRRTLRNFTERCNYLDQQEVLSELTYSDVRNEKEAERGRKISNQKAKTGSFRKTNAFGSDEEKVSSYKKRFGIRNAKGAKSATASPYKSSPIFMYRTVARRMLNITLQSCLIAACLSSFFYLLAEKLTNWNFAAFQLVCGPLFCLLGVGLLSAVICAVYSVCVSRWTPYERHRRGDYRNWTEALRTHCGNSAQEEANALEVLAPEVRSNQANKRGVNFAGIRSAAPNDTRFSEDFQRSGSIISPPMLCLDELKHAIGSEPTHATAGAPISNASTVRLSGSLAPRSNQARPPLGSSPSSAALRSPSNMPFNPIVPLTSLAARRVMPVPVPVVSSPQGALPRRANPGVTRARSQSIGEPAPRDPDLAELDEAIEVRRRNGSESPASRHLGSTFSLTMRDHIGSPPQN